jgi:hypothetical protein
MEGIPARNSQTIWNFVAYRQEKASIFPGTICYFISDDRFEPA